MDITWLRYVVDGGALVVLAVVLFGAWKLAGRFIDLMSKMVEQVQAGIRVQEQLQASVVQACKLVTDHETRTLGRLAEYEERTLGKLDDMEHNAAERHREMMRRINPPPTMKRGAGGE